VTIIHHPDVRRMLMSMKSRPRRCARWAMFVAAAVDKSLEAPDKGGARAQPGFRRSHGFRS